MHKTNAMRILELNKIPFKYFEYEVEEDLSGVAVARKINANPEEVFKTLVAIGDKTGYCVFCIPVEFELNLKKAAFVSCNKSVELVKQKDLLNITGYIRGGCSPIGMKKQFSTYIDETAKLFDEILVSAGIRGIQVKLSPYDLSKLLNAHFADLT